MSDAVTYARVGGPPANWRDFNIYLDGALLSFVVEADAAHGWVRIYRKDAQGNFIRTRRRDKFKEFLVRGEVRIVLKVQVAA